MGFFKKCMFSAVEGTVLLNGKPAEGVRVLRGYRWSANDEDKEDSSTTDKNGQFTLPPIYSHSLSISLLPTHEPGVNQYMIFEYQGKKYDAWSFYRTNYESGGEMGMSPLKLRCELSSEFTEFNAADSTKSYFGICEITN
ncbi:hypothetical protein GCM10009092_16910 [Bowmanella denitrificans]|uniref:DUF6795 domain-containing protein n=2 Tax=Bowmanella denitrificans TaxID=366582 RepID=A0ABP3GS80_9ALTE